MAKKRVAKRPLKAKVTVKKAKPKVVSARTVFEVYEVEDGTWRFKDEYASAEEAEAAAAKCEGLAIIATMKLPKLKY